MTKIAVFRQPSADLSPNTLYTLTVTPGAITDINGNPLINNSSTLPLTFTSPSLDIEPPKLTFSFPLDNQTHIAVNATFSLEFAMDQIQLGDGVIELHKLSDQSVVESFTRGIGSEGGSTSINLKNRGSVLEINPSADLLPGTQYYLTIGSNAILDLNSNALASISDLHALNFKTATDPLAAYSTQAFNPIFSYDEPASDEMPTTGEDSATTTTTTPDVTLNQNPSDNVGFSPAQQMPSSTTLAPETNSITVTPTRLPPASFVNDNQSFSDLINLDFHEAIQLGSGEVQLRNLSDNSLVESFNNGVGHLGGSLNIINSILTINPLHPLNPDSFYALTFSEHVVKTLAGDDIPALNEFTANFKTGIIDNQGPILISNYPRYSALPTNWGEFFLTFEFNENIMRGNGVIELHNSADQSVVASFNWYQVEVSNNLLKLRLPQKLPADTQYYLTFSNDAIIDPAGNQFNWTPEPRLLSFTTPPVDRAGPELLSLELQNQAYSQPRTVKLTFNEPIILGKGEISLHMASDGQTIETLTYGGGSSSQGTSVSETTLFVSSVTNLQPNTQYYVSFTDQSVLDQNGNTLAIPSDSNKFSFTTPDLDRQHPFFERIWDDGVVDELGLTNLLIKFNEPVRLADGEIVLHQADGSVVETFRHGIGSAGGYISSVWAAPLLFTAVSLINGASYYVTLAADAVTDLSGNAFSGVSDPSITRFVHYTDYYSRVSQSELSMFSTIDNSIAVPANQDISLQFSHPMKLGNGVIVLHNADDGSVVETFTQGEGSNGGKVLVNNDQITLDPGKTLELATEFYITIEAGALLDTDNQVFTGFNDATSLNFFTAGPDLTPPQLSAATPSNYSQDVDLKTSIRLYFNDEVQLGNGVIELHKASDGSLVEAFQKGLGSFADNTIPFYPILTLDPVADLAPGTQYYLTIANNAVFDKAGNAFAGFLSPTALSFETQSIEQLSPRLYSVGPVSFDAPNDIWLSFSPNIQLGTGIIELHKFSDGSLIESFKQGVGSLGGTATINHDSYIDRVVSLKPFGELLPNTRYYLTITEDAIISPYGYHFLDSSEQKTFEFTTFQAGPYPMPGISVIDNLVSGNLQLTFSEKIQPGKGNIVLHRLADDSVVETFNYDTNTKNSLQIVDNKLVINPSSDLVANHGYYLTLEIGALTDNESNPSIATIAGDYWNFKAPPLDLTPPTMSAMFPKDNQTHIAVDANLSLLFSESISLGQGAINLYKSSDHHLVESFTRGISSDGGTLKITQLNTYASNFSTDNGVISAARLPVQNGYLQINPHAALEANTEYYLTIDQTAVYDLSGNAFEGFADQNTLNFITAADPGSVYSFSDK